MSQLNLLRNILLIIINFCFINLALCGIKVAQPDELSQTFLNAEIEAIYGDFGDIDLDFEAVGSVWIMPRDLETNDVPKNYACKSLSNIKKLRDKYNFADFNIVLVEKGSCSFTQMAKEVEKIGGDMILVVNDEPGNIRQYKITNDGRGSEVTIPIAMISYNDGKSIINYITGHPNENVYLSVEIGSNKSNKVKVDIFTNILDIDTFTFLGKFKSYFNLLSNYIDLNIYYLTPKMTGLLQVQRLRDCLKNGEFCLNSNFNSKYSNLKEVDGVDLIYESLFHQCISMKSQKSYFNFIEQYSDLCINSEVYSNFCGLSLFNAGMREIVMDCVFNSFGNMDYLRKWEKPQVIKTHLAQINDNVNTILVNNRLKETQFKVNSYPDIYINEKKYTERLSSMYLFDSICDSFKQKPEPCLKHNIRPTEVEKEGIPWYGIVFLIVFVIFVNIVIFYCIKRTLAKRINNRIDVDKNDLSGQINAVIDSYFSLKEMDSRSSEQPANNLGEVENFMDDENDDKNQEQPKNENEPGSQLVMSNNISNNPQ